MRCSVKKKNFHYTIQQNRNRTIASIDPSRAEKSRKTSGAEDTSRDLEKVVRYLYQHFENKK